MESSYKSYLYISVLFVETWIAWIFVFHTCHFLSHLVFKTSDYFSSFFSCFTILSLIHFPCFQQCLWLDLHVLPLILSWLISFACLTTFFPEYLYLFFVLLIERVNCFIKFRSFSCNIFVHFLHGNIFAVTGFYLLFIFPFSFSPLWTVVSSLYRLLGSSFWLLIHLWMKWLLGPVVCMSFWSEGGNGHELGCKKCSDGDVSVRSFKLYFSL